ncbi:DNA gyrase inhibitor YacG [Paracidovorax sp. MALMAid1276]|uniref:DNA gyrase inhibitor YacG n=1 Tax=Paracidovorax sp. MALMAid1276 TaxID=3411631 RepID=UPI003B9D47E3
MASSPRDDNHRKAEDGSAVPAARIVPCPACGGDSVYATSNAYRPFCSQRCKQADLGAWANEDFRMPADAPPADAQYGDPRLQ